MEGLGRDVVFRPCAMCGARNKAFTVVLMQSSAGLKRERQSKL